MVSTPLHMRSDGIAVVTIDLRESEPAGALAALRSALRAAIERECSDAATAPTGIVFRIIGDRDVPSIDPAEILAGASAEQLTTSARELVDLFTRIEDLPFPSVSILEGEVLGAGFEAALACGHRIMVRSSRSRIGLPALSMGLLPAAGSVGRLLQHMPVRVAIEFLANAEALEGGAAQDLGLIDEIADSHEAAETMAAAWIRNPARQADSRGAIGAVADPAAAQAAAALAMAALPGRRRAAISLAAIISAWTTPDRIAASATELRRGIELATHADTHKWLSRHRHGGEAVDQAPVPLQAHGPVVSHHGPGHAAARIRAAGLLEAMALVGDGVPAARVEQIAQSIGMEPGPLETIDEISLAPIDAAHHASESSGHGHGHDHGHGDHAHPHAGHQHDHDHHAHGEHHHHGHGPAHDESPGHGLDVAAWPAVPPAAVHVLEKMAHGFGRPGRAAGAGFYDYPGGSTPSLWPGLASFERPSLPFDDADCTDRLVFAQVVEALSSIAAGVVDDPAQLDASARAAGFPIAGGITGFVAARGRASFTARCAELASRFGDRFALPPGALDQL